MKTNIAVLISGGGTNLQALIDAQKSGIIKSGEIKLVISNEKDAYGITRAKNADIPCGVIERCSYPSNEMFENALLNKLKAYDIKLIVLAGFLYVLSSEFVKQYPMRIINVHPSLIPSFCGDGYYGLRVHEEALKYGVKVSGASVHYVNEITDGGKIILQKAVDVLDGDTPEILQRRIMEQAEWVLLPRAAEIVSKMIMGEAK